MTPAWILDVLAALMLVVAAVSAARIAARPWRREAGAVGTDVAHLLMAIAMAGMVVPDLGTLPGTAWEVVFGVLAAWFGGRVLADARRNGIRALAGGHCAPHLVHSGSMLYMFLDASTPAARTSGTSAMPGGPGSAAMALGHPTLAFVLAAILVGYGIWDLDQLSGRRYATMARGSLAGAGTVGTVGTVGAVRAVGVGVVVGAVGMPVLDAESSGGQSPADAASDAERAAPAVDEHAVASRGGGADATGGPHPRGGFLLSPAVTVGCRLTMSLAMAFILLIAL